MPFLRYISDVLKERADHYFFRPDIFGKVCFKTNGSWHILIDCARKNASKKRIIQIIHTGMRKWKTPSGIGVGSTKKQLDQEHANAEKHSLPQRYGLFIRDQSSKAFFDFSNQGIIRRWGIYHVSRYD